MNLYSEIRGLVLFCNEGCREYYYLWPRDLDLILNFRCNNGVASCCDILVCREHENVCDYAPVHCPNSSLCPGMLRKVSVCVN